jgi:Zn finger protein HypA/HybF involved in hydrogenase expression
MKSILKGKMVKAKRDRVPTSGNLSLECSNCYWNGNELEAEKDNNRNYICPDCKTELDRYEDWNFDL